MTPAQMVQHCGHGKNVVTDQDLGSNNCALHARNGTVRRTKQTISQLLGRDAIDTSDSGPAPDGGIRAWIIGENIHWKLVLSTLVALFSRLTSTAHQVLCSHFVVMNTWGFANSFGAFQAYFVETLGRKPFDISWIGSMQVFLLFFLGTFTGRLTDGGYFRPLLLLGTASTLVGLFASSFCCRYWQFFLALGVTVGIGNGCLFCPMLTVLSTYFDKRRATAIGIAACGSATGGLIYPTVVRQLLPSLGFPWLMRIIGFIQLVLLIMVNIWLRPRIAPRRPGPLLDWMALKETSYVFYTIASFFASTFPVQVHAVGIHLLTLYPTCSAFLASTFPYSSLHPSPVRTSTRHFPMHNR